VESEIFQVLLIVVMQQVLGTAQGKGCVDNR
jgi:hypothetical protein